MITNMQPTSPPVEILIAEDSLTQAQRLRHSLEKEGYHVTHAVNGRLALEAARQRRPALAISDINMPEMDGYELCRRMKADEHLRDVRVILLTSLSSPADVLKSLACGADSFLTKPYSEDYLLSFVGQILAEGPSRHEDGVRVDLEIPGDVEQRPFNVSAQQMLTLLLSTYEAAIHRNNELITAQAELRALGTKLETLVEQRTAALSAQVKLAQIIGNNNADGIIVVESQRGTVRYVNPAAVSLFGEELLQQPLDFLTEPTSGKEFQIRRSGVERHDVELNVTEVAWDGTPAHLATIRDITKRKQAEERMQRVQAELEHSNRDLQHRNEEIQNFYHTLSHELKTPLTSAREFVSIVVDGLAGPLSPTQLEYLGLAKESCDQMRVHINDLLDVTRLETGKLSMEPKPTDLGQLVDRIVRMMQPVAVSKGIEMHTDLAPALPEATIDESRITQVLINLLNNALKFTPSGGNIRVQVCLAPRRPDFLRVSVSDTGRGISTDHQEHIFDRLYQVKRADAASAGGLGLGLYICRELVELHGGSIWVESTPGQGSTFSFDLPQSARARQIQVLIVDDEPNILAGIRACLEREMFAVTAVSGGAEALRHMQYQLPDLVLLDLQMPHPNGAETLKEIRRAWGPLPVILHTAFPDSELMMKAMEASPFTLLSKPCEAAQLVEAVRTALASGKVRQGEHSRARPLEHARKNNLIQKQGAMT